ncbi:hypothetical protein [Streptomyces paludis]|uniref:ATP-binding protein n=1 Tax=Streptomyces paludis TaxID=2282738 RepID=A0A345HSC9_9ACTN|nr:hypothetical protein [Streptomyces paludis]AXG79603.1 hypothetical protein DVK44_20290 [Streptomyces paludis]
MKPTKITATVVATAGSVLALAGAVTPALAAAAPAAGPAPTTSLSLNGGVEDILAQGLRDPQPLHSNALDTERPGSVLHAVNQVTQELNKPRQGGSGGGQLLGGMPLGK